MKHFNKIVILNHHQRKSEGKVLKKIIEQEAKGLDIEVVISFDDGSLGLWGNYVQALSIPSENENWRFIVHDDIQFPRGTIKKMLHILDYAPKTEAVSFYNPSNKDYRKAFKLGYNVLRTRSNFWPQCTLFPVKDIEDFLSFCENNIIKSIKWEDVRLEAYLQYYDKYMNVIIPSLVQHIGGFRSIFKIPGFISNHTVRYSLTFANSFNPYEIDWEKAFANPYKSELIWKDVPKIIAKLEMRTKYEH